jgi:hypothetical protein
MTTLCRSTFVSIAATMAITLSLGACASAPSRSASDGAIPEGVTPPTIRFENFNRESVDVYLIGEKREWRLGRVATGSIASLRLPDEAFVGRSMVQLAVLAGEHPTFAAARDPRAVVTIAQPAASLLSRYWTFSQGDLKSLRY